MKILILTFRVPKSNGYGDAIVTHQRLRKFLTNGYKVKIVFIDSYFSPCSPSDIRELSSAGVDLFIHKLRMQNILFNLITKFFLKTPIQCSIFTSNSYKKDAAKIVKEFKPDYVYASSIRISNNIPLIQECNFELIDSLALNYKRKSITKNIFKKILFGIESKRLLNLEKYISSNARTTSLVSKFDKSYIGNNNIIINSIGVNSTTIKDDVNQDSIVFHGNLNYEPNDEAITWFIINCWNHISQSKPEVKLKIIGKNPSKKLKKIIKASIFSKNIFLMGYVESLDEELSNSSLAVAPMTKGSGMQFKILESLSCGLPVVTTSLGFGGLSATPNSFIWVEDKPIDFSNRVLELLGNKEKLAEASCKAIEFIEKEHLWSNLNDAYIKNTFNISINGH
jgi:glycosyltransferase involved in cell wall biosynthesis